MSTTTDSQIDSFAAMVKGHAAPIREQDNVSRLRIFAEKLPKRLPQSFESFLCRYSFPAFDVMGISLFGWDSDSNEYVNEASADEGSSRRFPVHLSEFLIPAGYVQIGRPDGGDFDAICFDFNQQSQKPGISNSAGRSRGHSLQFQGSRLWRTLGIVCQTGRVSCFER